MIGNLVRAGQVVLLLAALLKACSVGALSDEENLAYIDRILKYLNNNSECTLPTYNEISELQKCFAELQQSWGPAFESRLTDDQRLVKRTILMYWDSFQRHMDSPVIVRSAKKRSFLCKIEDYQEAKFGDSVCTRIKDIRGPITNHIFEKSPLVRYIKHIKTGEVVEAPVETAATGAPSQEKSATGGESTGGGVEATVELASSTKLEVATERASSVPLEPTTHDESQPTKKHDSETGTSHGGRDERELEKETRKSDKLTPQEQRPEGEMGRARDEHEQEGVQHTYIGKFTLDFSKPPDRIELNFERAKRKPGEKLDDDRDPLDDIPVPSSRDEEAHESQATNFGESDERRDQNGGGSSNTLPMFDEFGAEYIEQEYDDADLERLVRVPKRDWQFDPVYGYFKWPDECSARMCPIDQQPDEAMLSLTGAWQQFVTDPYAYDELLESIKRSATTTPKPRINAARLRQQKSQFDRSMLEESRRGQLFGWNNEHTPEKIALYMPEIKRDRWRNLADNNFCKLAYNTDYLKNKSKKAFASARKLVRGER